MQQVHDYLRIEQTGPSHGNVPSKLKDEDMRNTNNISMLFDVDNVYDVHIYNVYNVSHLHMVYNVYLVLTAYNVYINIYIYIIILSLS